MSLVNIDAVRAQLKDDEGWRESAYEDHLGYLTIGYGFMIDARRGGKLPRTVAEYWLTHLIQQKWEELRRAAPWVIEQPEPVQHALVNMAYQLGVPTLMRFQNMIRALRNGDRKAAAEHALDSRWATQTPNRAQRVADMIRGRPAE